MITYTRLYLGIAKYIQAIQPTVPFILKGAPYPSQDVDDFIMFDILRINEVPQPAGKRCISFTIQLICYAKHAQQRSDGKVARHLELADIYGTALHRKAITIAEPSPSIETTCAQLYDAKITPLDLRNLGDFAKEIYANTPPLQLLSAVIIQDGVIYGSDS